MNNISSRKKAIVKLYKEQVECPFIIYRHSYYQFMQYLLVISDKFFDQEFGVYFEEDFIDLIRFVKEHTVSSLDELKLKVKIAKHLEYSWISATFSERFKLEDIPDKIIIDLFENIENRLQRMIEYFSGQYFVIVRRISDNAIWKSMVTEYSKQKINESLQCFCGTTLCDVVVKFNFVLENVQNLNMRSLNYAKQGDNIQLTLKHPESITFASLRKVKIANMRECTNLQNLFSYDNLYVKEDIERLTRLKRIYSYWDKYEDDKNCLLYDLFAQNKLEYVHIYNDYAERNTMGSMTLNKNIENLRYLYIYQHFAKYDIKLDVTDNLPKNLCVYDVLTAWQQGQIITNTGTIFIIQENLIHYLKMSI